MPEYNGPERRKENSEVFDVIGQIRGDIRVILTKIDNITISMSSLQANTVTREELKLNLETFKGDIKELQDFRRVLMTAGGLILLGVLGVVLSHIIPGIKI